VKRHWESRRGNEFRARLRRLLRGGPATLLQFAAQYLHRTLGVGDFGGNETYPSYASLVKWQASTRNFAGSDSRLENPPSTSSTPHSDYAFRAVCGNHPDQLKTVPNKHRRNYARRNGVHRAIHSDHPHIEEWPTLRTSAMRSVECCKPRVHSYRTRGYRTPMNPKPLL
jgi:hypothetical protein